MMDSTGNIFLEVECNWEKSWIFKYDNLHIFAYWNNNKFYLFNWNKLKKIANELLISKEYRIIKWWDWWRVTGILIPERELIPKGIAERIFYI